jgi:DNA invertase Pin-like site-specific DNA recombinase
LINDLLNALGAVKMKQFVSYLRVSTQRQGVSGLGLAAQREAIANYLAGKECKLIHEYVEIESGKRHQNRPKLQEALKHCKKLKATLIVGKLDRLGRNTAFIASLMESGVDFLAADLPEANTLVLHIMAAMAEYERTAISTRTKAALAQAKARGVKLGGPKILEAGSNGRKSQMKAADRHAANVKPVIDQIKLAGITTLQGIADTLNVRGIPTARGGQWYPGTVKRLIDRTK